MTIFVPKIHPSSRDPSSIPEPEKKRRLVAEAAAEHKAAREMRLNRLEGEKRLLRPAYL